MSVEIKYIDDGGLVFKASGIVGGDELVRVNADLYRSEARIKAIKYQLVDLTGVEEFQVEPDHMRALARQDSRVAEMNPGMTIAIVSPAGVVYGMNRMYQSYFSGNDDNVRLFSTVEEALAWSRERKNAAGHS